jgi:uncharacterized protein
MNDLRSALLELQTLDDEIHAAEQRLAGFEPRMAALEQPVRALEHELETARTRLGEMRESVLRLEKAAEQKRERLATYESKIDRIRNMREETAIRTEMSLIRGAAEADEDEAVELMEQATRTDLKLDELTRNLTAKKLEVDPQRQSLLEERQGVADELDRLRDRRNNHVIRLDPRTLQLYERVRRGRSRMAVAPLTAEGACGHCYNILPIQQQSEVRREDALVRCEACGVILYIPESAAS